VFLFGCYSCSVKNETKTLPVENQFINEDMANTYNTSLYDPSLVRLSTNGPYPPRNKIMFSSGCMFERNPSTYVAGNSSLKTSSQWYIARPDKNHIIVEPTGWSNVINPVQYWYSNLISFSEYQRRLSTSNTTDVSGKPDCDYLSEVQPF
jgi:hypothetical protein